MQILLVVNENVMFYTAGSPEISDPSLLFIIVYFFNQVMGVVSHF